MNAGAGAAMPARGWQTDVSGPRLTSTTASTNNASLNGAYNFIIAGPHEHSWGQTLTCGGNPVFMGGSDVRDESAMGTGTADGAGNISGTFTLYGQFNQSASDASVTCTSGGNAVYDPPCTLNITGTYSVQSNGSGTMVFNSVSPGCGTGGTPPSFIIQLSGACSSGISNTIYLVGPKSDNSVEQTGIARYQSTC